MDCKREYKDAPGRDIRLPREVYYRCLWTVRDLPRLITAASAATPGAASDGFAGTYGISALSTDEGKTAVTLVTEETAKHAAEELRCIWNALEAVPEAYRRGILGNIMSKTPPGDFAHPNTWKRWKLVFLHELARELHLI